MSRTRRIGSILARNSYLQSAVVVALFFLAACTPATPPTSTTPATPVVALRSPDPTATWGSTPTIGQLISRQQALLYSQDFEGGSLLGITERHGTWIVSQDDSGNSSYCNGPSDHWQSFKFGKDGWSDYAIEMKVKLLTVDANTGAEVYSRVDLFTSGYRGSLHYRWAALGFYPPSQTLGGASVNTTTNHWYTFRLEAAGGSLRFFVDSQLIADTQDTQRLTGMAGFGAGPNTLTCVDDVYAWALTPDGQVAQIAPVDMLLNTDPNEIYEGHCVFCFIDGSDPYMPVWNDSVQGYVPQENDTRERIVIDETFVVPAGQTVTYENKIILIQPHQRESIQVHGTLVIKNSLLLWQQTQHQQTLLQVNNGATLDIENSYSFQGNQYWVNWVFNDGSTISFDRFIGDPWTGLNGSVEYLSKNYSTVNLTVFKDVHDTHISISDAHHVWFEFFPTVGTHVVTFPEKRQWSDWTITDLWLNTTIAVTHSYIYERDMSLSNDVHVTVMDTPGGFSLGWSLSKTNPGYVECELDGLGEPGNEYGVFYENATWDLPCINSSLTVINSVLQKAWPVTSGYVHLKVSNSNLADPRNYGAPSTYEIYHSTIDHAAAYAGGVMYIEDSEIRFDVEVNGVNSAIYVYGVTVRTPDRAHTVMREDGGQYIKLDSPGPPWY